MGTEYIFRQRHDQPSGSQRKGNSLQLC